MKNIWKWLKVALGVVLSVFAYMFFSKRGNSEIRKKIKEVKNEAKKEEEKVKKIEKKIESRKEEAGNLADRLKKHFLIIISIVLFFSIGVVATDTLENLKIPETYDELVIAYKDMAEIAIGYQKLYNEAEADNNALIEVTKNLQELMVVQQEIIDDLLQKNRFGFFGGLNFVPLNPTFSGVMAGVTFEF